MNLLSGVLSPPPFLPNPPPPRGLVPYTPYRPGAAQQFAMSIDAPPRNVIVLPLQLSHSTTDATAACMQDGSRVP